MNFIGKVVPVVTYTPGKRVGVKVIWKNFQFYGKYNGGLFPIANWDNLQDCTKLYALPTNTFFTDWHEIPYIYINDVDSNKMLLRFWGKYRGLSTIYGKIIDGIFYESNIYRTT